ncbi:hypothetical protein N007_08170 [Alicyclobacillus acidoterrestris ATCC 49025]|nr:hypothetical protein N007_08170 [Alicyclobacillus acidoterrestris ATCC 49025]
MPLARFALAWVLHHPAVTCAIIGSTKKRHLLDAIEALDVRISDEQCKTVDEVTAKVDGLV